jgi:hypothetical protein
MNQHKKCRTPHKKSNELVQKKFENHARKMTNTICHTNMRKTKHHYKKSDNSNVWKAVTWACEEKQQYTWKTIMRMRKRQHQREESNTSTITNTIMETPMWEWEHQRKHQQHENGNTKVRMGAPTQGKQHQSEQQHKRSNANMSGSTNVKSKHK